MDTTSAAFYAVCKDAVKAQSHYVSLYRIESFYGGPEEGGWWGHDYVLVASQECSTDAEANALANKVSDLAEELSKQAKDAFNRGCAMECEWLEARGLDADYLPEVDGEDRYAVYIEERAGEMASTGDRHYS